MKKTMPTVVIIFLLMFQQIAFFPLSHRAMAETVEDQTPPVIENISIQRHGGNVEPGDTITFNITISDDSSGVEKASVFYRSPATDNLKEFVLAHDSEKDVWTTSYELKENEEGDWRFDNITSQDFAGNTTRYDRHMLNWQTEYDFTVQTKDLLPPVVESIEVTGPAKANSGSTIRVSANITDDLSGVNTATVYFQNPEDGSLEFVTLHHWSWEDTWNGSFNIDTNVDSGQWRFHSIYVRDKEWNTATYYRHQFVDAVQHDFIVQQLAVPTVKNVSLSSDVVHLGEELSVVLELSENELDIVSNEVKFYFTHNETMEFPLIYEDGVWQGSVELDANNAKVGDYHFGNFKIEDANGNTYRFYAEDIANYEELNFSVKEGVGIEPLSHSYLTSNTFWSNETIDGDLYIGPEAILDINGNVTVKGDMYIFGAVRNYGNLTVDGTLYARQVLWSNSTLYHGTFLMLGGTNHIQSMVVSSAAMHIPLEIYSENLIVEDGKVTIEGATLPFIDLYANNQKVNLNADGTFRVELNDKTLNRVTFKTIDVFGRETVKHVDVVNHEYDSLPPYWPEGSSFEATNVGEHEVTLTWDPALDNVAVTEYRLYKNGDEIAIVSGDTFQYTLTDIQANHSYSFVIKAVDDSGNVSEQNLSVVAKTKDETAPFWPEDSAITVSEKTETSARIHWSAAEDNDSVAVYHLYKNGDLFAELEGDETSYHVSDVQFFRSYHFEVEAIDRAGNISSENLSFELNWHEEKIEEWADNVDFYASNVGEIGVMLAWYLTPGISELQYLIYQNGELLTEITSASNFYHVEDLNPEGDYTFEIELVDPTRTFSSGKFTVEVTTKPLQYNELFHAIDLKESQLMLSWDQIFGIEKYRLFKNGKMFAELPGMQATYVVKELEPTKVEEYVFELEPIDIFGETRDRLSYTVDSSLLLPANVFTDIQQGHRFYNEILFLRNRDIIFGFDEGKFAPDAPVTRAAAATMIARALELDGTKRSTRFSDVGSGNSASGFIESAAELGIIQGFPGGAFRPTQTVTRGQMAIFLARAFELEEGQSVQFSDVSSSLEAYDSIKKILAAGITVGYPDGTYRPDEPLTRAQFSALLSRAMK